MAHLSLRGVRSLCFMAIYFLRVPTSSGNHGKPGKSRKKNSMHGTIMEFEKKQLNNHGEMGFFEIV